MTQNDLHVLSKDRLIDVISSQSDILNSIEDVLDYIESGIDDSQNVSEARSRFNDGEKHVCQQIRLLLDDYVRLSNEIAHERLSIVYGNPIITAS